MSKSRVFVGGRVREFDYDPSGLTGGFDESAHTAANEAESRYLIEKLGGNRLARIRVMDHFTKEVAEGRIDKVEEADDNHTLHVYVENVHKDGRVRRLEATVAYPIKDLRSAFRDGVVICVEYAGEKVLPGVEE